MAAGLAGARVDFGPDETTAVTIQGDIYRGGERLSGQDNVVRFNGGNLLARIRRTFASGAQLQVQGYYDNTYRRVVTQYGERRHTGDVELQYRFSAGARHAFVAGGGVTVSHDRTTPTSTFFFDPASRTLTLANVFLQDEITLVPGRVTAILGTRLEHNSYTGVEMQPTGRVRWTPRAGHTIWGGVSRAVRMPTRFDTDLRFTANQPFVVLRGSEDFDSETMIGTEVGYRTVAIPKVALGIVGFTNAYDDIRSQEPTPPLGVPVVLDNQHEGRISGLEVSAGYQPGADWDVSGGYTYLRERFSFDPGSRDVTGGSLEHNDPSHQIWLRLGADLPGGVAFDAMLRRVSALPAPVVPAYTELNLHVARLLTSRLEISLAAENLLHDRHAEWFNLGPRHAVPRSAFVRLTWRSR
jgi:iron complex outermembrane receptor protein